MWTTQLVERQKAETRGRLLALPSDAARREALEQAIAREPAAGDSEAEVARYVAVMSLLVLHLRTGCLTGPQERALLELGQGLLRAAKIKPVTSRLAWLYGELHQLTSQLAWGDGRAWSAVWEQQMALRLAGDAVPGGTAFGDLTLGLRLLRLGHGGAAVTALERAGAGGLAPEHEAKRQLNLLIAYRLLGRRAEAAALSVAMLAAEAPEDVRLELAWEELLRRVGEGEHPSVLVRSVRRGGPHASAPYLVEAHLWTRARGDAVGLGNLPKLSYLARKKELDVRGQGEAYELAAALERLEDDVVPHEVRLRDAGRLLERTAKLPSLDKELLVWAAVARWLAGNDAAALAETVAREYAAMSRKVTAGASEDALQIGLSVTV